MVNQIQSAIGLFLGGTVFAVFLIGAFMFFIISHSNRVLKLKIEMRDKESQKEKEVDAALFAGEEKERVRISEELHDGLGAKLTGIKMQLEHKASELGSNQSLNETVLQLNQAINELREISHHLQPEFIYRMGLVNAINRLFDQLNSTGTAKLNFYTNLSESVKLDRELSIHIYRIISELVNNCLKHAQAKEVFCQVLVSEPMLSISVEDNGIGFDSNKAIGSSGIGLLNLQKRVELLSGTWNIDSGNGTSIHIELPLS